MTASGPEVCAACGASGSMRRLVSAGGGVIFRGSGFYATDYKRPGTNGNGKTPEKTAEKRAGGATGPCGSSACASGCQGASAD
jgi:predicted nucleic acid-binding Zn ribbon protein